MPNVLALIPSPKMPYCYSPASANRLDFLYSDFPCLHSTKNIL